MIRGKEILVYYIVSKRGWQCFTKHAMSGGTNENLTATDLGFSGATLSYIYMDTQ